MTWVLGWMVSGVASAFCGTYLGPAGEVVPTNGESVLVLSMKDGRTVLTMANDYQGDVHEFGLLVPVPAGFDVADASVADAAALATLDGYSGPRLVSYTCEQVWSGEVQTSTPSGGCTGGTTTPGWSPPEDTGVPADRLSDGELEEVVVQSRAMVGSYELSMVSAQDTDGLQTWLESNGLALPEEVEPLVQQYLDHGTWFLAATVSAEADAAWLEPLQLVYDAEVRAIPLKLGTTSSSGVQDLVLYTLARGRVAITNYREGAIEDDCMPSTTDFYDGLVDAALAPDPPTGRATWAIEYGWSATSCDPCSAAGPLDAGTLAALGWDDAATPYVTRMRMRYLPEQIDEDLLLQVVGDFPTIQQRYVARDEQLEDLFPVCGEGFVADPGSCGPEPWSSDAAAPPPSPGGGCLCASVPTTASAGTVALILAALRRRRGRSHSSRRIRSRTASNSA